MKLLAPSADIYILVGTKVRLPLTITTRKDILLNTPFASQKVDAAAEDRRVSVEEGQVAMNTNTCLLLLHYWLICEPGF